MPKKEYVVEVVMEDVGCYTEVESAVQSITKEATVMSNDEEEEDVNSFHDPNDNKCTVVSLNDVFKTPLGTDGGRNLEEVIVEEMCSLCLKHYPITTLNNGHDIKGLHSEHPLSKVLVLTVQTTLKLPKSSWYLCSLCTEVLHKADEFHVQLNKLRHSMTSMKRRLLDSIRNTIRSTTGEILSSPIQMLTPVPPRQNLALNKRSPYVPATPTAIHTPEQTMFIVPKKEPAVQGLSHDRRRSFQSLDYEEPTPGSLMAATDRITNVNCPLCQKSMKVKNIKKHMNYKHKKQEPIICRGCVRKFPNENSFAKHVLYRHEAEIKLQDLISTSEIENCITLKKNKLKIMRKPCPVCGVVLNKHYLKRHIRHHDENFRVQCKLCPETFKRVGHRLLHMREVHGFPKPAPKVIQPATCHLCRKTYRSQALLKRHLNTVHMDVKQMYKCHLCDKMFKGKYLLKSHMTVHTDDRPYMCQICNKNFKVLTTIRKHLRKVHKLNLRCKVNDPIHGSSLPIVKLFEKSKVKLNYTIVDNVSSCQS